MTVTEVPTDPRYADKLGRTIVNHDPRNFAFAAFMKLPPPRQAKPGAPWYSSDVFDQQGPSCTAQAATGLCRTGIVNRRAFKPHWSGYDSEQERHALYLEAQKWDPWPGENYSGSSTDAPFVVLRNSGHIAEWRWLFGADQLRDWVRLYGPAAVGTRWYTDMFRPDSRGYVRPTGTVAGGHAYRLVQYSDRLQAFRIVNSWGRNWGQNGRAWIRFEDMRDLLQEDGEAVTATLNPPKEN